MTLMGWCSTCNKLEDVMLTPTRRRPACVKPELERREQRTTEPSGLYFGKHVSQEEKQLSAVAMVFEASELGLRPGEWPSTLFIDGVQVVFSHVLFDGEIHVYRPFEMMRLPKGGLEVHVLND